MKRNKLEILNTVLLALIVILQVVTMLWLFMRSDATISASGNTSNENGSSQAFPVVDVFQIDTPYATLKYPNKWKEKVTFEESEEKDSYAMTFYAQISGQQVELFSVYFGLPEKGDLIGYVAKGSEQVPFTVDSTKIERADWSKEDYNTLCNMQEDINVLINSVLK